MSEGRINIIDATPIEAAQSGSGKGKDSRGRQKSTDGFSVHTGIDEEGFIHRQGITPGHAHDSRERDRLVLGDESALVADAAYSSKAIRDQLARLGIDDQVQRKADRGKPLSREDLCRETRT